MHLKQNFHAQRLHHAYIHCTTEYLMVVVCVFPAGNQRTVPHLCSGSHLQVSHHPWTTISPPPPQTKTTTTRDCRLRLRVFPVLNVRSQVLCHRHLSYGFVRCIYARAVCVCVGWTRSGWCYPLYVSCSWRRCSLLGMTSPRLFVLEFSEALLIINSHSSRTQISTHKCFNMKRIDSKNTILSLLKGYFDFLSSILFTGFLQMKLSCMHGTFPAFYDALWTPSRDSSYLILAVL